ncbi:MAG: hypothetical protein OZ928_04075 [Polyangiaceae bacterium]|nr:hypothetical protein [Polyangiaceae bacterium]
MHSRSLLLTVVLLGVAGAPAVARAQPAAARPTGVKSTAERKGGSVYEYFTDQLGAAGNAATGWVLTIRKSAARSTLIRPRVSFVPELLKSADTL